MEEVNGNELPMEPLHFPAVAIGADQLLPMATASTDGQICAADGGAATEVDAEQLSNLLARLTQKLGWTRSNAEMEVPFIDLVTSVPLPHMEDLPGQPDENGG